MTTHLQQLLLEEWQALVASSRTGLPILQSAFPFLMREFQDSSRVENSVVSALEEISPKIKQQAVKLSLEEVDSIWKKLLEGSQIPGSSLEREDELYLEQQLADILGVEVAAQADGYRLPATFAVSTLIPNWKSVANLPMASARPDIGWAEVEFQPNLLRGISLPLFSLPAWQLHRDVLWQWFARRPVVVCNPTLKRASLAYIVSQGPDEWWRHQVGVTELLANELGLWSYPSSANVSVWFLLTPDRAANLPNPAAITRLQHLIDHDYFGPELINTLSGLLGDEANALTSLLLLRFLTLLFKQSDTDPLGLVLNLASRFDWGSVQDLTHQSEQGLVAQMRDSSERLLKTLVST